jgi:hypothetical protein
MKIGIIVGSTREGNVGKSIGEWVYLQAKARKDVTYELVEVSQFNLPMLGESNEKDGVEKWQQTISVTVVRRILILMNSLSLSCSPITICKHHKYSGIDFDVDAL